MSEFLLARFDQISIDVALYAPPGSGDPVHKNRQSYGLAFYRDEEVTISFENGDVLTTQPNCIVYIPKGSNYTVHCSPKGPPMYGAYVINFQCPRLKGLKAFKFNPKNGDKFFHAFREAEAAWRLKTVGYNEKCCKSLYDILLRMKQEMTMQYVPNAQSIVLSPAVDYISENYTYENISIDKLAQLCGISQVYLRRLFHLTYGTSPIRYINNLKLMRARELIDSGEYTIGKAAAMSGFFDASYFSREFKKEFGLSPMQYSKERNAK